jgi:hypothetical protein
LWNVELFDFVCELRGRTHENVIGELKIATASCAECEHLLDFCSSRIHEHPNSLLKDLTVELLFAILSHHSLIVCSEDKLYEFVRDHILSDRDFSILLQLIRFESVSSELIDDFVRLILNSFDMMTLDLWQSIIPRLRLDLAASCRYSPDRHRGRTILPNDDAPFDGIFCFLRKEVGGNIHEKGIVSFSASGQYWGDHPPQIIADPTSRLACFATPNAANSWICMEFKYHGIRPTHYSICSRIDSIDDDHLRSWVIEGWNDKEEWIELDGQNDRSELTGTGCQKRFTVSHPCDVRMIRLRQTGKSSSNQNYLNVRSLELFGDLWPCSD